MRRDQLHLASLADKLYKSIDNGEYITAVYLQISQCFEKHGMVAFWRNVYLFIGVLGRVDCTGHFAPMTYTLTNQRAE